MGDRKIERDSLWYLILFWKTTIDKIGKHTKQYIGKPYRYHGMKVAFYSKRSSDLHQENINSTNGYTYG